VTEDTKQFHVLTTSWTEEEIKRERGQQVESNKDMRGLDSSVYIETGIIV
jgi:hypothetical protein